MVNIALLNIVLLGCAYSFIVMTFITIGTAQKRITLSLKKGDPNFKGHSYINLTITYVFYAIATTLAPSLINLMGPRPMLIIASVCHLIYDIQYLFLKEWLLFFTSALCGIGTGLSWTAQGRFVTGNSTETTITRNSGIFWSIMQSGRLVGYVILYFQFNSETISKKEVNIFYGSMVGACFLSLVFFCSLRKAVYSSSTKTKFCKSFIAIFKLVRTRDMLLLIPTFAYCGIQNCFYTGIYNNAIGFCQKFDFVDMKLVALSGLLVSCGEIVGGASFGIFGHRLVKKGRYRIIISGCLIHLFAGLIIILNLPNESSLKVTHKSGIISNVYVALFCSFLIGFGDACFCTQIYGILASIFSKQLPQSYAIYSFVASLSAASAYGYSSALGLFFIVGIFLTVSIIATILFCIVELKPSLKKIGSIDGDSGDENVEDKR